MIRRDLDEIKAIREAGDEEFNSYLVEKDRYIQLLDAYSASLALVSEGLVPAKQSLSAQGSLDAYGVSGEILYRKQQAQIFENLLNSVFTPNHKIFISYNQKDELWWRDQRTEDIQKVRKRLLKDIIPRLVALIEHCRFSDLQNTQA